MLAARMPEANESFEAYSEFILQEIKNDQNRIETDGQFIIDGKVLYPAKEYAYHEYCKLSYRQKKELLKAKNRIQESQMRNEINIQTESTKDNEVPRNAYIEEENYDEDNNVNKACQHKRRRKNE